MIIKGIRIWNYSIEIYDMQKDCEMLLLKLLLLLLFLLFVGKVFERPCSYSSEYFYIVQEKILQKLTVSHTWLEQRC